MEMKEILKEYIFLNKEQLQAAIDYAKRLVSKEESYIFDKSQTVNT
jgi:uncharacterized protein (DUF433 family)